VNPSAQPRQMPVSGAFCARFDPRRAVGRAGSLRRTLQAQPTQRWAIARTGGAEGGRALIPAIAARKTPKTVCGVRAESRAAQPYMGRVLERKSTDLPCAGRSLSSWLPC